MVKQVIVTLQAISIIFALITYFTACTVAAFRKADSAATTKTQPRWKLRYAQLSVTALVLSLSIARCGITAFYVDQHSAVSVAHQTNQLLVCDLFSTLVWLVLSLGLVDSESEAGYDLLGPWIISLSFDIITLFLTIFLPQGSKSDAEVPVEIFRIVLIVILVLSNIVTHSNDILSKVFSIEPKSSGETQPLLDHEDEDAKSEASVDSWDTVDDPQEKEDRLALRSRTWWQYVASFKIFINLLRPKSKRQYFYLTGMVINTIILRAITLLLPLTLGAVINKLATSLQLPWKEISMYVALRFAASQSGVHLIRDLVSFRLNLELHRTLTAYCFSHLMGLSADYHLSKSTPGVWQIIDRGDSVVDLFQDVFFSLLPMLADLVIALIVVYKLFGAYLCFSVATTMVLFSWSNRRALSTKTEMRRKFNDLWRDKFRHMNESLGFWRTVAEFNQIDHEREQHNKKSYATLEHQVQQRVFKIGIEVFQEIVLTVGFFITCIMAAEAIVEGRSQVGQFVVLITYWGEVMSPVTMLAGSANDMAEKLVDAEKMMLLLERQPSITDVPNAPPFRFKGGSVEFENVSFSYDEKRMVTEGVSFRVESGQTVALVGETGGGKSTILSLLFRLYDPLTGRIIVDGQDVRDIQLASFRDQLGLVPQNPALFNVSVMENIRYSNLNATDEEVIAAAKAASLHDKIMTFSKQYRQKVGERAQKLSGGELQRLAIARMILKKPNILLLDEATSAVDSVTESKIQDSLKTLCEGRTTFIIAHRLSTILHADLILVIKDGKLAEKGSHKDLIQHDGPYRALWAAQLKLQTSSKANGGNGDATADAVNSSDGDGKPKSKPDLLFIDDLPMGMEAAAAELLRDLHETDGKVDGATEPGSDASLTSAPDLGSDVQSNDNDNNRDGDEI